MFKDDQSWRFRPSDRFGECCFDRGDSVLCRVSNRPVVRISVPDDTLESKHFLGNHSNTVVSVSVRRSPKVGNSAAISIIDDLHRPTQLGNDLLVRLGRHMRMRPSVDGDLVVHRDGSLEKSKVGFDVATDHVVRG